MIFDAAEQNEYDDLLNEVLGNSRSVNHTMVEEFREKLLDAEQAQRGWAVQVLDRASLDGLRKILKDAAKRESVAMVNYRGQMVGKATRVGRRRTGSSGRTHYDQTLMDDLTWDELGEWLAAIEAQISALVINTDMAKRLLKLREEFPDTSTPRQACALLGTTVADYLGADSA